MSKRRAYRATKIKNVDVESLVLDREPERVMVGLDVSKDTIFAVLRRQSGESERPWTIKNPAEILPFTRVLERLGSTHQVQVAMEPTGTYGDPLRQALADLGIVVQRVSPKVSHDYAEVYDGVPSQHDGKDAAIVAELAAAGKASPWKFSSSEWEERLARHVDWLEIQRQQLVTWCGRLEGLLARHWPEAGRMSKLTGAVLLRCLAEYGGPQELVADDQAAERLWKWGRGQWSEEKIQVWLKCARQTTGVRQSPVVIDQIKQYAGAALACRREIAQARRNSRIWRKGTRFSRGRLRRWGW